MGKRNIVVTFAILKKSMTLHRNAAFSRVFNKILTNIDNVSLRLDKSTTKKALFFQGEFMSYY